MKKELTKAEREKRDKEIAELLLALVEIQKDAKIHGYRKGHGGTGQILCPVCRNGNLNYSVASINGHIWASCSTKTCVHFMQ